MAGRFGRIVAVVAAFGLAGSAGSAQERRAPVWQVDWGQQFCSLIRRPDEGSPFVLALRLVPGNGGGNMVLLRGGSGRLPRRLSSVVLAPSGQTFDIRVAIEEADRLELTGLSDAFWDAFASASELQLKADNQVRHRIALIGARGALGALRQCEAEVMREWGIDVAAWRSLQRRPRSTNNFGLRDTDYPPEALNHGRSGRVLVRIDVDADGEATGCALVASSGNAALDGETCRVIMGRGRFEPALDGQGQPVAARTVSSVTWLAPP